MRERERDETFFFCFLLNSSWAFHSGGRSWSSPFLFLSYRRRLCCLSILVFFIVCCNFVGVPLAHLPTSTHSSVLCVGLIFVLLLPNCGILFTGKATHFQHDSLCLPTATPADCLLGLLTAHLLNIQLCKNMSSSAESKNLKLSKVARLRKRFSESLGRLACEYSFHQSSHSSLESQCVF